MFNKYNFMMFVQIGNILLFIFYFWKQYIYIFYILSILFLYSEALQESK